MHALLKPIINVFILASCLLHASNSASLVFTIETIDIECVLLSFLSKKFVSTKWRIYKGILVSPVDSYRKEFRAVAGSANCFFQQSLQKKLYRDLKWKNRFVKEKIPFQWFFLRKAIVLK